MEDATSVWHTFVSSTIYLKKPEMVSFLLVKFVPKSAGTITSAQDSMSLRTIRRSVRDSVSSVPICSHRGHLSRWGRLLGPWDVAKCEFQVENEGFRKLLRDGRHPKKISSGPKCIWCIVLDVCSSNITLSKKPLQRTC